jgi:transcriptional regulator with XRE-family HTH domain
LISEKPLRCGERDDRIPKPKSAKSIFAERLKAEIDKKGWSLRRTAEEVGLHLDEGAKFGPAHVWHYLQARTLPRPRYLVALSRALGLDPDELMPAHRSGKHRAEPRAISTGGQRQRQVNAASGLAEPGGPAGPPPAKRDAARGQGSAHLSIVGRRAAPRHASESPLVLLLSNDRSVLLSVEGSLRTYGYEMVPGDRQQETLQLLRSRWVGVLVADLGSHTAERLALVRAARQADPTLPVIYTVQGMAGLPVGERVAGAPCLRSPYHPHQLLNLIRQVVRRTRDEGEPHAA